MSTTPDVNERLAALTMAGTSVWLDQIRRSMVEGGELQKLIDEDSLRGVTSNPSIFEKAILGSDDYDDDLREMAAEGLDAGDIFRRLSVRDIQLAADVLKPVWDDTGGYDGYVSLEVHPDLARDTAGGTLEEARALWKEVDRPNVMIKIPGTSEGLDAIERAIGEGINVNVTLLFSVESYANVAEAYIKGLKARRDKGESVDVHSVASFFVSRVDSKVDKLLESEGGHDDLLGVAGLANARAAYQHFKEVFHGEAFRELRDAGAPVQRPLWASTGVKNPNYSDTMYVDGLAAPETVNTMPMPTLLASAKCAEISGHTADQDPSEQLKALADAGIDMEQVTEELLDEGIETFVKSFDSLLAGIESRREAVTTGRPSTIESSLPDELEPAITEIVKRATGENVARRVWSKDETLWGGPGPEIGNRLGWLTIADTMLEDLGQLQRWVEEVRADGFTHAVLLGMGGSSLGPEVIRRSFGPIEGGLELHVLDSTDPEAVLAVEESVPLEKTLFIVSSKSGGTIETLSHFKHFWEKTGKGAQFCAVTDPGSPLEGIAAKHEFRKVWRNDPDIGGRYSVLSYFGLVPAALMGVAVDGLLHASQVAEQNTTHYDSTQSNSGLWLGLALGELAKHGRDKLTFVVDPPIDSFGLWVEQLIAESTGKHGRGILPVADEPLGDPEAYGEDRVFAYLRSEDEPDAANEERIGALQKAGHPVLTFSVKGASDLGRLFFFSEFAVAVTGWVLDLNPFDQPNVQEAKDATNEVLKAGDPPEVESASDEELMKLLDGVQSSGYVSLHGWLAPSEAFDEAVAELRTAIRERTKAATTFGYGPRFLHSTGQLHKGGPATGSFVQLMHDSERDADIPGAEYGFRTLKHAQALGDLRALQAHDRPVIRVNLEGDPARAVRALAGKIKGN